uniref:2-dehydro-3-deoxygalactonokinase n=1 Tax=Pararhizobium sp. IMCC3301 TaxID=3067904 RepID=UPI00274063E4|nr:2-dehydro-3-deoxygalactonokinase [Pararhizobium sp. IMCC3301]
MSAPNPSSADMIAIDWGTTNCRGSLLDANGDVLDTRYAPEGAGGLHADGFESVFERLVDGWPELPVWICGMAGSRQGWREAPYLPCPALLSELGSRITQLRTASGRIVCIVPGLLYRDSNHNADIMRGEETQIAGLLARQDDFEGLAILPGTHCKWVAVKDGKISRFQTFLTGELYSLLATASILRHSVPADETDIPAEHPAFLRGFDEVISGRVPLVSGLFQIRTQDVLNGAQKDDSAARLSGLMIGAEFAAAETGGWFKGGKQGAQDGFIIGGRGLTPLYAKACELVGIRARTLSGLDASSRGLWYLAHKQRMTTA